VLATTTDDSGNSQYGNIAAHTNLADSGMAESGLGGASIFAANLTALQASAGAVGTEDVVHSGYSGTDSPWMFTFGIAPAPLTAAGIIVRKRRRFKQ